MTPQEILEYNKRCLELIGAYFCNDDLIAYPNGYWMIDDPEIDLPSNLEEMQFHSDWNLIHYIIDIIEELGSHVIMGIKIYGNFEITRYGIKFHFTPNNKYLLQLELKPYLIDNGWKHPMFKHNIIKVFDFKNKTKKDAVVQAINEFLIWYNNQSK